jgi:hypothetical protein
MKGERREGCKGGGWRDRGMEREGWRMSQGGGMERERKGGRTRQGWRAEVGWRGVEARKERG